MDIVNFFEKVEGTWFSQRTTHFAPGQPSETGQTTLQMVRLSGDDPRVAALCDRFGTEPQAAVVALSIEQNGQTSTYGSASATSPPTTLLVAINSGAEDAGAFFSQTGQEAAIAGQYSLQDEVLTLKIQTDELESEERVWFMNPNLRMRTSMMKRKDGFEMASFCSEIRRLSS